MTLKSRVLKSEMAVEDQVCTSCGQAGNLECVYSQCSPVCDPKTLECSAGPV